MPALDQVLQNPAALATFAFAAIIFIWRAGKVVLRLRRWCKRNISKDYGLEELPSGERVYRFGFIVKVPSSRQLQAPLKKQGDGPQPKAIERDAA